MAGDTERLFVQLEARISDFEKKMQRAERRGTRTYQGLSRNSRRTTRQMEQDMARSTTAINRRLATMQRSFTGLGRTLAGGLGIGIATLSMAELSRTIGDVIRQADGIGKAADRIGLSTTALQELRYAGELAGVSTSALEMSMQRFSRRIGEAASGTGQLKDVLEANGVELRDSEGNLRPLMELLEDYARLIQNAGSEQEQLTLAVKAFDSEGAVMVNMLRDGAQALRDTRQEANDLGGVLEEDLIRSAEDVNDRFTQLTTTVGTNFKRGILGAVVAIDSFIQRSHDAADAINDLFNSMRSPEARMRGALANYEFQQEHGLETGSQNFFDRSGFRMPTSGSDQQSPTTTIIPGGTDEDTAARTRNAAALVSQANATRALIERLQFENSLIGKSQEEIDILTAQRAAGANATNEQRETIAQLIRIRNEETASIDRQAQAHKANQAAMGYLAENAIDGLFDIASGAQSAEEAIQNLALSIAQAAAQAALFGQGPFAGAFGGSGGLFGNLFGSPMGFAGGGQVRGPGTSTSDSIPARLSDGEFVVNAKAVKKPGMLEMLTAINAGRMQGFSQGGFVRPNAESGAEMVIGGTV